MKGRDRAARLEALEDRASWAAWQKMTHEERWAYIQEWRAASPAFNRRFEAAEQRIKAMTDAELRVAARVSR